MNCPAEQEPRTWKSIPRHVSGCPTPTFLSKPGKAPPGMNRKLNDRTGRVKHYYARALDSDQVYRFEYPSDQALWVAQGAGTRESLRGKHTQVVAAKVAAARGEYEWPTPEWKQA